MRISNVAKRKIIKLDFSVVRRAYSSGMLAIIAIVNKLRSEGYKFEIIFPSDIRVASLFIKTNWAHHIDSSNYKINAAYDRHLFTRHFKDDRDIADLTNDFMNVVLRTMVMPKDIISALEWAIYEICDNVINHADSKIGGFIDAITYSQKGSISFTVADAGRGILNSLREGLPKLEGSADAIMEAIKEGVTRNTSVGQGNGLAGSNRITNMTGGSFDIISGTGRVFLTPGQLNRVEMEDNFSFEGTSVSGCLFMNKGFSIGEALVFKGVEYFPTSIIEMQYEDPIEDLYVLKIREEPSGVGTRKAGKQIHTKVLNLLNTNPDYRINIDWREIEIIASSFADEFIGKLYWKIGRERFLSKIKNINLGSLVKKLLDKAIEQRKGNM